MKLHSRMRSARAWSGSCSRRPTGPSSNRAQTRIDPAYEATAVDATSGDFQSRAWDGAGLQSRLGIPREERPPRGGHARRRGSGREAQRAARCKPGKRDLILDPTNLWLTIHESVGHPTELDRALGYEANFAGTSFATPDKLGTLYAAPIVTLYADKTTPGGLATVGYDDDGVRTQQWNLVEKGLFVGLPDDARAGRVDRREGLARLQLRDGSRLGALPAHAQRLARRPATRTARPRT